jgi:hypothetical protein
MCMADGYDPNRVSRSITRKAIKEHRCAECSRTIAKGEQYHYDSGIDSEGFAFSHKTCAHCHVPAQWLSANCGGYVLCGIQEDLQEHVSEYARRDLARLFVAMRRDWRRFRGGGLMPIPKLPRPIKLGDAR